MWKNIYKLLPGTIKNDNSKYTLADQYDEINKDKPDKPVYKKLNNKIKVSQKNNKINDNSNKIDNQENRILKNKSIPKNDLQQTVNKKTDLIKENNDKKEIINTLKKPLIINMDAQGEYLSQEEILYRKSLIKNLKIKTVIINNLSKGNGITQEYYRVVFIEKMIPIKILDQIIESKEFRDLIPSQYLYHENRLKGYNKKVNVIFNNKDIKKLLLLWCEGELTPIQKAWETQAVK